jgi:bacteriocin-like protein
MEKRKFGTKRSIQKKEILKMDTLNEKELKSIRGGGTWTWNSTLGRFIYTS